MIKSINYALLNVKKEHIILHTVTLVIRLVNKHTIYMISSVLKLVLLVIFKTVLNVQYVLMNAQVVQIGKMVIVNHAYQVFI